MKQIRNYPKEEVSRSERLLESFQNVLSHERQQLDEQFFWNLKDGFFYFGLKVKTLVSQRKVVHNSSQILPQTFDGFNFFVLSLSLNIDSECFNKNQHIKGLSTFQISEKQLWLRVFVDRLHEIEHVPSGSDAFVSQTLEFQIFTTTQKIFTEKN